MTGKSFWAVYNIDDEYGQPFDIHVFSNLGDALRYAKEDATEMFPEYLEEIRDGGQITGNGHEVGL